MSVPSSQTKQEYLAKVKAASELVSKIIGEDPSLDPSDLFHAALAVDIPIEELLRRGLRRRTIYGATPL